jgi:hypothetical protein
MMPMRISAQRREPRGMHVAGLLRHHFARPGEARLHDSALPRDPVVMCHPRRAFSPGTSGGDVRSV